MNSTSAQSRTDCVIFGGGGHAAVVIDALIAAGDTISCSILAESALDDQADVLGVPVFGDDSKLPALLEQGATSFVVGIGSTGDGSLRQKLFEHGVRAGLKARTVIHPRAVVSPSAVIGEGTVVLAGAIVNARARIGRNVIVNTGAIVEHDCVLADHVHISPGARLGGTNKIGELAHVGIGSVTKQDIKIGARAVVAAGAVVTKNVDDGLTVTGVPARPQSVDGGPERP